MEKNKVEFELIYESKAPDVDKLFNVYRKDPKKARVLYFNDSSRYTLTRIVLFKYEDGSFEFCHFIKKFGISTTNRIYHRETKVNSIIYKKKKFYHIQKKSIKQLTYSNLMLFCHQFSALVTDPILKFMVGRFSWIRFISEDDLLHNMSFNTFTRYKLYSLNDALKHRFKNIPLPVIKNLRNLLNNGYSIKIWKEMSKVLINMHKLNSELYNNHLFFDTCKMARTLDKKVNCGWSINRLTQEHDAWSKEITNIVLDCEDEYLLNINSIYIKFADISGFNLLKTNKDLLREGMNQKHCVGTYINKVNSGKCGIYHIAGYTLELSFDMLNSWSYSNDNSSNITTNNKYLNIIQFRGKFNFSAPNELCNVVRETIFNFNKRLGSEYYKDINDIKVIEDLYNSRNEYVNENFGFVQQHDNPELPLPF